MGLIDLQTSAVIISCCECTDKIPYSTNRSVSILDSLTQTVVMIFQVRYQSLKMILLSQMANERQYSFLEGFEDNCQNQRLETCRYRDPCFYPTQFSVFVKCRRQLYLAVCCGLQHICTGSDSNSLEPQKKPLVGVELLILARTFSSVSFSKNKPVQMQSGQSKGLRYVFIILPQSYVNSLAYYLTDVYCLFSILWAMPAHFWVHRSQT